MALLTLVVATILLLAGLLMAGVVVVVEGVSLGDLAQVVLTPIVTLTGTALGFYFGTQSVGGGNGGGDMPPARKPGKIRQFGRWLW